MAKINAINNWTDELTLDQGSTGIDPFVQYDIGGTGEFRLGIDDDDSDMLKLSQGSSLGTNDTFKMTTDGAITMPLQPAFSYYNSSTDSNVTGDGTNYTCDVDSSIFDQSSSVASDTFTAPITGRYLLTATIEASGLTSSHDVVVAYINTSNRTFMCEHMNPYVCSVSTVKVFKITCLADMDASDTATTSVLIMQQPSGGSKVVDIIGGSSPISTCLQGFLVA